MALDVFIGEIVGMTVSNLTGFNFEAERSSRAFFLYQDSFKNAASGLVAEACSSRMGRPAS